MASSRDPEPDLSLERLGDRGGLPRAPLGEAAQVRSLERTATRAEKHSTAYQALIDAAFTAPGAAEWLAGMGRWVAALVAGKDATPQTPVARDAIRAADPRSER